MPPLRLPPAGGSRPASGAGGGGSRQRSGSRLRLIPMHDPIRMTIDSTYFDQHEPTIQAIADEAGVLIEIAATTVSEREKGVPSRTAVRLQEVFVIGESAFGVGVLGSEQSASMYDAILGIISNNSFPTPDERELLPKGYQRQVRDAMVLEAHGRAGRDIFITGDATGFIGWGRRERLEALCSTKIMTLEEFRDWCSEHQRPSMG